MLSFCNMMRSSFVEQLVLRSVIKKALKTPVLPVLDGLAATAGGHY